MKIKKLNESTKFKVNDKVFVKPNKKQGRVLKVKGDYITVEMDNGKDPIRIDTYYDTDLEAVDEITESKPIKERISSDDKRKALAEESTNEKSIESFLTKFGFNDERYPHIINSYNNTEGNVVSVSFSDGINAKDYRILKKNLKDSGASDIYLAKRHIDSSKGNELWSTVEFEFINKKNEGYSHDTVTRYKVEYYAGDNDVRLETYIYANSKEEVRKQLVSKTKSEGIDHVIITAMIPEEVPASYRDYDLKEATQPSGSIDVATTSDDKRKALANYLNVDVEDVVQTYDENNFEVQSTGEEYIVADYDTAYDLAEQDVINTIDDLGIDAFTPYFQEWIMDYAVNEDWFKDALAESQRYYYEDMDEDEFIEVCKENDISPDDENAIDELVDIYLDGIDDYVDEFKSIFGDSEFSTAVKENDLIDLDKVVEEAIRVDGIAHFIAGYDGEEIELNDDLFAYRTN